MMNTYISPAMLSKSSSDWMADDEDFDGELGNVVARISAVDDDNEPWMRVSLRDLGLTIELN